MIPNEAKSSGKETFKQNPAKDAVIQIPGYTFMALSDAQGFTLQES